MALAASVKGESGLIEQPGSPRFEYGEQGVEVVRRFVGTFAECQAGVLPVGAELQAPYFGFKVKGSTVERNGTISGRSILEERYAGAPQGAETPEQPLPANECEIQWERMDFAMEKLPRYRILSKNEMEAVKAWVDASKPEDRAESDWTWNRMLDPENEDELLHAQLCGELEDKLLRGETQFFMWCPVYTWTVYSWTVPTAWSGGEVDTAIDAPIGEPSGWEWLRAADQLSWNGKYWKLTMSWIGAFEWDPTTYPVVR